MGQGDNHKKTLAILFAALSGGFFLLTIILVLLSLHVNLLPVLFISVITLSSIFMIASFILLAINMGPNVREKLLRNTKLICATALIVSLIGLTLTSCADNVYENTSSQAEEAGKDLFKTITSGPTSTVPERPAEVTERGPAPTTTTSGEDEIPATTEKLPTTTAENETIEPESPDPESDKPSGPLKVHFIDVGQGDSILIQTHEGNAMLIDGGSRGTGIVGYLKKQGIAKINVMVATHPHEDHIGGLIDVMDNFKVDNVIDSGLSHTTRTYKDFVSGIQDKDINYVNWSLGQKFSFGNDIEFKIIGPVSIRSSDLNNSSIVIRLTYHNNSFLFTGDVEGTGEGKILASGAYLKSDVLKVAHHGSSSSSSFKFLQAVRPSISIISCGRTNSYGHPHDITLKNLSDIGTKIYRTDLSGNILLESDGENITVVSGSLFDYPGPAPPIETESSDRTSSASRTTSENSEPQASQQSDYLASKKSDVFHRTGCGHAKKILPENIICFESREEALANGYRPCKTCSP
jgi:competence protein ComEC